MIRLLLDFWPLAVLVVLADGSILLLGISLAHAARDDGTPEVQS